MCENGGEHSARASGMNLCTRPPCGKGKLSHFFGGFVCLRPPCGKGKLSHFFGGFVLAGVCARGVASALGSGRSRERPPSEAEALGSGRPRERAPSGADALGSGSPRERTPLGSGRPRERTPSGADALGRGRPRERTPLREGFVRAVVFCLKFFRSALRAEVCFTLKNFAPRFARKCLFSSSVCAAFFASRCARYCD